MRTVAPPRDTRCIPILIGEGEWEGRHRIGGCPPAGVVPGTCSSSPEYFGTFPLGADPSLDVSIFTCFDMDRMLAGAKAVHTDLIQSVVHPAALRGEERSNQSRFAAHPLVLQPETDDWLLDDGKRVIRSGHKIGGRPYLEQPGLTYRKAVDDLLRKGFRQVLQVDFPGPDDAAMSGDWPFGDGIFHVFARSPFGADDFRYSWER